MNKFKYIICILGLLIFNCSLVYKINSYSKDFKVLTKETLNYKKVILNFEQNFFEENRNENIKLKENIKLIDINGETKYPKDIFKKHTIVLRYSEFNCSDCINEEINNLVKNENEICIITHYIDKRMLHLFYEQFKNRGIKNFKMYLILNNNLDIPLEKLNIPYYFCIDSNLRVTNVFIPQKEKPKLSENYLVNVNRNFVQ